MKYFAILLLLLAGQAASACELCAIYGATDARGESDNGFRFTIAEQYIPYDTSQFNGQKVQLATPSYVDSSMTHLVPSYNFSRSFGVSLSIPVTAMSFRRTDVQYSASAPPVLFTEKGSIFGLGDAALIGRATVFRREAMKYGVLVNVLAGAKFPTGNDSRLDDEVEQAAIFESFLPPGTPHDPLAHSISSVHQHDLALGSGSFDGVFGVTLNSRWQRWFLNGQWQYYLRTPGEAGFRYGNEMMISGGPGAYVLLRDSFTISAQINGGYDHTMRDELLGKTSDFTGMTAWYLGPQLGFTFGSRFSAVLGVDLPIHIANNGFQSVPDYRLHASFSCRF